MYRKYNNLYLQVQIRMVQDAYNVAKASDNDHDAK